MCKNYLDLHNLDGFNLVKTEETNCFHYQLNTERQQRAFSLKKVCQTGVSPNFLLVESLRFAIKDQFKESKEKL